MAKHLIQFTQINFDAKMRKCKTAKNIQICENVGEFLLFETQLGAKSADKNRIQRSMEYFECNKNAILMAYINGRYTISQTHTHNNNSPRNSS